MGVSCNIDEVINFLVKKKEEGYKKVEIIDGARACGWHGDNPTITFITNKSEPRVIGIDCIKTNKYK